MNAVLGSRYRYSNPDQNVGTSHRAVKTEKQEVPYNARSITEGRRFFCLNQGSQGSVQNIAHQRGRIRDGRINFRLSFNVDVTHSHGQQRRRKSLQNIIIRSPHSEQCHDQRRQCLLPLSDCDKFHAWKNRRSSAASTARKWRMENPVSLHGLCGGALRPGKPSLA